MVIRLILPATLVLLSIASFIAAFLPRSLQALSDTAPEHQAPISFDRNLISLGNIRQTPSQQVVFTLRNHSTTDAILHGAVVNCGCTTLDLSQMSLSAGSSLDIPVTWNLKGRRGQTKVQGAVKYTLGEHSKEDIVRFHLSATVQPSFNWTPSTAHLPTDPNSTTLLEITKGSGWTEGEITRVEVSHACAVASLERLNTPELRWQVAISRENSTECADRQNLQLVVYTTAPGERLLSIPIKGK